MILGMGLLIGIGFIGGAGGADEISQLEQELEDAFDLKNFGDAEEISEENLLIKLKIGAIRENTNGGNI